MSNPGSPLAPFMLSQMKAAVDLFTALIQQGANISRYQRNLKWLKELHSRALSCVSSSSEATRNDSQQDNRMDDTEQSNETHNDNDSSFATFSAWRTRLIKQTCHEDLLHKIYGLVPTPASYSDGTDIYDLTADMFGFGSGGNVPGPGDHIHSLNPSSTLISDFVSFQGVKFISEGNY